MCIIFMEVGNSVRNIHGGGIILSLSLSFSLSISLSSPSIILSLSLSLTLSLALPPPLSLSPPSPSFLAPRPRLLSITSRPSDGLHQHLPSQLRRRQQSSGDGAAAATVREGEFWALESMVLTLVKYGCNLAMRH